MDIIPDLFSKSLTKDTISNNYLLIVDTCYKIPRLFGMENITTEEVVYNPDMFQSRSGKLDNFWMVEFGANPHRLWYAVYLQGFSRKSLYMCSKTYIISTGRSGNEFPI